MGSLWRSEEMQLMQLFIQTDAAKDTIDELGKLNAIQFVDLNPTLNNFQRNFVNEIKRCEEAERKLRFVYDMIRIENKANKNGDLIDVVDYSEELEENFDDIEIKLDNAEKELKQMNVNLALLDKNYNELLEMKHVLSKESTFFSEDVEVESEPDSVPLLLDESNPSANRALGFRFLTGVVAQDKFSTFERVLWRSLRGNLFMKSAEIEEEIIDPTTGALMKKLVFIVFYQGEQSALRIKRICDSFGARVYPCSSSSKERMEALGNVNVRINEVSNVLEQSREARRNFLSEFARNIETYFVSVRKNKSIYTIMNMCNYDVGRKCLIAEGWCPTRLTDDILNALSIAQRRSGSQIPSIMSVIKTKDERPTNFPLTEFTGQFQMIVDAYGVARYGEVNPGVFTIITFPFLFAIMFGDAGHSTIVFLAALAMIFFEKKIKAMKNVNDIFLLLFDGRYLIFVMSLFGLLTGFLYNDFFGLSATIFKSQYNVVKNQDTGLDEYVKISDSTYPFGIDPTWRQASNELVYENSMKMKISVIVGVIQMTLGVILGLFNSLRSKQKLLEVSLGFVPKIIFMVAFFGYMCFIIIYKWMVSDLPHAPFLINVLIDMVLSPGSLAEDQVMFSGQAGLQIFLFLCLIISAIALLIPKPIILIIQHKRRMAQKALRERMAIEPEEGEENEDDEDEHFALDEVIIVNCIDGVEYILSCISNTASYLRLWALSLAHSQLSSVFYEQVMLRMIKSNNFFLIFIGFAVWGGATLAVLCMMEALSAFLHALRLHWVEFQNKFFAGDGYQFVPFSNADIVRSVTEDLRALELSSSNE